MALQDQMVAAVLSDWRTAPIDERTRAMLGFLEKLTLSPGDIEPDDAAAVLAAGVTADDFQDAVAACSLFNTITRVADTLGFDLPSDTTIAHGAEHLLRDGYLMGT